MTADILTGFWLQTEALAEALGVASVGADREAGAEGGREVALVDLERVYQVLLRPFM